MKTYDIIVIGGGPGGYVAAIRGSQLGLKAALVEKDKLGGVCLNWGCIPTKSLLRNAEVISLLNEGKTFGFEFDKASLKIDYAAAQKRSREVSAKLVKGIEYLMKKNNIDVYSGRGVLKDAKKVEIQPQGDIIEGKNIIIATGSRANMFPGIKPDADFILTAKRALELTKLPLKLVIVGAGAIGMEFANIWNSYGVDVTVVEMASDVLPLEDKEISAEVRKNFEKRGIKVLTGTKVEKIETDSSGVTISVSNGGKGDTLESNMLLLSAGVRPNSEDLGLEKLGVAMQRGYIQVDDFMRTNVGGIYAIGDVTGKMPLAHVASAQGITAVDKIAGKETKALLYHNMPRCTYCIPETASVGLTEAQAREKGYDLKIGTFPFQANGKAIGLGETAGFVKIVAEAKYGEVLGVHMVGPHVTEILAGPTGLIALEGTYEELANIVHPHPSLSEAIMEAAHAVEGKSIHI
jgi:dihydrolipoamide dehydrogenase